MLLRRYRREGEMRLLTINERRFRWEETRVYILGKKDEICFDELKSSSLETRLAREFLHHGEFRRNGPYSPSLSAMTEHMPKPAKLCQ